MSSKITFNGKLEKSWAVRLQNFGIGSPITKNYLSFIIEAIQELKDDQKGSSVKKIKQWIETNHKIELDLPILKDTMKYGIQAGFLFKLSAYNYRLRAYPY